MKKNLIAATAALLLAATAFAQGQDGQKQAQLQSLAKKFQSHIPRGWSLQAAAEGDLNSDNVPDAALAIRNDRAGRLLVLLQEGGGYKIAAEDKHLVFGKKSGELSEHFEYKLGISEKRLDFFFHNPEGSHRENYSFRLDESGKYRLTGLEFSSDYLASEAESFDLLAQKCSYAVDANPQEIENLVRDGFARKPKSAPFDIGRKLYLGDNLRGEDLREKFKC